jgi:hypothetical protein
MPGRALVSGSAGFVGWLARLEKPIEIVAVITILATTVFMYWIAGREVGNYCRYSKPTASLSPN